jgi:parallel beta-helix repeat protein
MGWRKGILPDRGNSLLRNGNGSLNTGGIFMGSSSGIVVEKNAVMDSTSLGIILRDTKNSHILQNTVTGSTGIGIELCNGSRKNVVEENIATSNYRASILVDEPKSSFCDGFSAPSG